ncbi:MAG: response regulator [Betaproteobacteria bacterium]
MSSWAEQGFKVHIVDDDAAMRDSLSLMLGLLGYSTLAFESAEAFLDAYRDDWTGCVVADLRLAGKSGLQLLAALRDRGSRLAIVIITGHGDVTSARAAFQSEAVDFLEKPFEEADLCSAIEKGLERNSRQVEQDATGAERDARLARLTRREREILGLVGRGLHAKEIAASLGISPRTVEVHKARVMEKLDAHNVAELVRFALTMDKSE